jgi:tetraacyldisaccharide 4'-kinase
MMAAVLPEAAFAIGPDKKRMAAELDRRFHADVILIDDGFQRRDIAKEADLVVIDVSVARPGNPKEGRLFPRGRMREGWGALGRATAIFVMRTPDQSEEIVDRIRIYNSTAPIVDWDMMISGISSGDRRFPPGALRGEAPLLFAGIGSFERLERMLANMDLHPVATCDFGDHYRYDLSDVAQLRAMAREHGAGCYLTTAKDAVKLSASAFDKPLHVLELSVSPRDPAAVDAALELRGK